MPDTSRRIVLKEMLFDLHYRLRLADELFCEAAEALVAAAALEEWKSRSEALEKIRAYSQALQIIHRDQYRIFEDRRAVFPPELAAWVFETPEGEITAELQLKRLHAIAQGLELALDRELLKTELHHE